MDLAARRHAIWRGVEMLRMVSEVLQSKLIRAARHVNR